MIDLAQPKKQRASLHSMTASEQSKNPDSSIVSTDTTHLEVVVAWLDGSPEQAIHLLQIYMTKLGDPQTRALYVMTLDELKTKQSESKFAAAIQLYFPKGIDSLTQEIKHHLNELNHQKGLPLYFCTEIHSKALPDGTVVYAANALISHWFQQGVFDRIQIEPRMIELWYSRPNATNCTDIAFWDHCANIVSHYLAYDPHSKSAIAAFTCLAEYMLERYRALGDHINPHNTDQKTIITTFIRDTYACIEDSKIHDYFERALTPGHKLQPHMPPDAHEHPKISTETLVKRKENLLGKLMPMTDKGITDLLRMYKATMVPDWLVQLWYMPHWNTTLCTRWEAWLESCEKRSPIITASLAPTEMDDSDIDHQVSGGGGGAGGGGSTKQGSSDEGNPHDERASAENDSGQANPDTADAGSQAHDSDQEEMGCAFLILHILRQNDFTHFDLAIKLLEGLTNVAVNQYLLSELNNWRDTYLSPTDQGQPEVESPKGGFAWMTSTVKRHRRRLPERRPPINTYYDTGQTSDGFASSPDSGDRSNTFPQKHTGRGRLHSNSNDSDDNIPGNGDTYSGLRVNLFSQSPMPANTGNDDSGEFVLVDSNPAGTGQTKIGSTFSSSE